MVVCAVRSGEARRAVWEEIDLDNPVWTIPAAGIRANCGHRVPLSDRALEVLRETAAIQRGELVFPAPATGRALSVAALGDVVRTARIDAVPHGFRSSFRDWAAERTETPHAVMEAALAHVVGNRTEVAYARSDLFERRRRHGNMSGPRRRTPPRHRRRRHWASGVQGNDGQMAPPSRQRWSRPKHVSQPS